jgi:hypothetical protein
MNTKLAVIITIDGVEQKNPNLELGAFDQDGICRGAKRPVYRQATDQYIFTLQLKGVADYTVYTNFKVYDHESETELDLQYVGSTTDYYYQGNFTYSTIGAPIYHPFHNPNGGITKEILGYGDGENHWYLISSPVGEVNPAEVTNMINDEFDLYYFDAANPGEEWVNRIPDSVSLNDFNLMPGQGYLYARHDTATLTFPGEAYDESGQVYLVKYGEDFFKAWNLVGNPFNALAYIDRPFYRMNEDGSAIMPESMTGAIEAMEGIFVVASEDGETMTFSTEAPEGRATLAINVSQGRSVADRAIVTFGESSALPKFQLNQNRTKVYIPQEGKDYAVVSAGEIGEMPVNFKAESNGTYNMNFTSEAVNFSYLHLIDNMTGADVDLLATPSYSFDALTTDYASRFRLVFATSDGNDDNFAFFNNGNLVINNDGNANLQVVDVAGRILNSESINGSATIKLNVAAGVYMIRLTNGNNVKVQKMVVK